MCIAGLFLIAKRNWNEVEVYNMKTMKEGCINTKNWKEIIIDELENDLWSTTECIIE